MAADNNLERFALENLAQMRKIGSNDNMNILVLLDRSPGYDRRLGDWTETRLFRIRQGDEDFSADKILDCGERNMSDAANLAWLLDYCAKKFPAEKTALCLWSHGTGAFPDGEIPQNDADAFCSVVQDWTTGYSDDATISMQTLRGVLERRKVDVVHFDVCLMQTLEVLWELSDCAQFVVASQANVPAQGMDYQAALHFLRENPSPAEFALALPDFFSAKYIATAASSTLSTISTQNFSAFKKAFADFSGSLCRSEGDFAALRSSRETFFQTSGEFPEFCDLFEFAKSCAESELAQEIKDCAKKLCDEFSKICLKNAATGTFEGFLQGISVNFPFDAKTLQKYQAKKHSPPKIYCHSDFDEFSRRFCK